MLTRTLITLVVLHFVTPAAYPQMIMYLSDKVDNWKVIDEVAEEEEEEVQASGKRLKQLYRQIYRMKENQIEKVFGKPVEDHQQISKAPQAYAVAQPRKLVMSGLRRRNPNRSKAHIEYYSVKDVAYLEVYYSPFDGVTPRLVIMSFPVDKSFPKLTKDNLEERLKWEAERLKKIEQRIANAKPKEG